MNLNQDESYKLAPMDTVGSGSVQEKQQAYLVEIIQKVNGLFEGELTDDDQLVYVNGVSKEQFANSPDLKDAMLQAIMDAQDAHTTMSTQALASARMRESLRDILLGTAQLYETLRERSASGGDNA